MCLNRPCSFSQFFAPIFREIFFAKSSFAFREISRNSPLYTIGNLSVFDIFSLLYHLHNDTKNPCSIFIMLTLWKHLIMKIFVQTLSLWSFDAFMLCCCFLTYLVTLNMNEQRTAFCYEFEWLWNNKLLRPNFPHQHVANSTSVKSAWHRIILGG